MRCVLPPGIRVVRGPNWIWQNQDEGEGHVGTVCEIGRWGSTHSPENTVVVNWDSGHRTNYRVGYQNQYDLIIVDNAQVGVRHSNVVCDGCAKGGIAGIVFKCAQCANYHLCSYCYGADLHEKEHSFIRYTTPTSLGVPVPPRKGAKRIQLKGIFVGSKVVRGPDWEWGQQDGGEGKSGRVMDIRGWDNESCRSVANVSWTTGSTNVYRLGHKGNVDLKYVVPSSGGYYYKDHMPVLGQHEEQQPVVPSSTKQPTFSVGDRVKVCLDVDALIKLQQGHGGWNPRMIEHLSKLGTVHRITEKGDIRVQYESCPNRWTFHPAALIKVLSFRVGDLVTVINDANKVQQLQKGHGEWIDLMRYALGKLCKVIKVYSDGDLRIEQLDDGFEWTLNPKCVKLERSPLATAAERSNSMMDLSHRRTDHVMTPLSGLSGTSMADKLVREAAQGHIDFVKQYLTAHPGDVNIMSGGKTCIQVAAHQGFADIVKFLISKGANVNAVDKEGDSALHYAAFGNQPETMRILLQNGAEINYLNSSHCSALHICAHKKTPHCVRQLLAFSADVNIQDSYGDTALHDAIGKENTEVVELLCGALNLDFTVKNHRGFNVLHHAALKGNVVAAKRILQLARQLVDVKKDDGFAALHLAALNGHAQVVEVLVKEGRAEIDIRNNRRQTPFLLAVSQGHCAAIEKLVKLGCDIAARDEDGDNALHLCVIKKANVQQAVEPSAEDAPEIYLMYENLIHLSADRLMFTILCYLSRKGCRIEPNNKGANIFEWITDNNLKQLILSNQRTRPLGATSVASSSGSHSTNSNVNDATTTTTSVMTTSSVVTPSSAGVLTHNLTQNIQFLCLDGSGSGGVEELANTDSASNFLTTSSSATSNMSASSYTDFSNSSSNSTITNTVVSGGTQTSATIMSTVLPSCSSSQALGCVEEGSNNLSYLPNVVPRKTTHLTQPTIPTTIYSNTNVQPSSSSDYVSAAAAGTSVSVATSTSMLRPLENSVPPNVASKKQQQQQQQQQPYRMIPASSIHYTKKSNLRENTDRMAASVSANASAASTSNGENNGATVLPTSNVACQIDASSMPCSVVRECIVCDERLPLIRFEPCHHQISCEECGRRMKKCLKCGVHIERRLDANGLVLLNNKDSSTSANAAAASSSSADRLRYLEHKIQEYEESHYCSICMERSRDVAFLCGHGACSHCAETLRTCHMCRKTILKKINLY